MEGGTNMSLELSIADKLSMLRLYEWQGFSVPIKPADFHFEAATMLRQQQAEIEELKDKLMLAKQSLEIIKGYVK